MDNVCKVQTYNCLSSNVQLNFSLIKHQVSCINVHLVSKRVHDDAVRNVAQRVDVLHKNIGRDLMKVDVLQKTTDGLVQADCVMTVAVLIHTITVFFTPH